MDKHFYFVRHGQTEANALSIIKNDSPLTELGKNQARQAAEKAQFLNFDKIYHSPLPRAYDTAKIINTHKNAPLHEHNDFREWFVGKWDGITHTEFFEKLKNGLEPEEGETSEDFCMRVYGGIQELLAKESLPFLITAHGGTFYALKKKLNAQTNIDHLENCKIIEFTFASNMWVARDIE